MLNLTIMLNNEFELKKICQYQLILYIQPIILIYFLTE